MKKQANTAPKQPARTSQRPLEGTKGDKKLPTLPPREEHSTTVQLDASVFKEFATWALPLTKTADPTRNFHLARFTGTHLCFSDGIAGIAFPFVGLKDVVVPGIPLFQIGKSAHGIDQVILVYKGEKLAIQVGAFTASLPCITADVLPTWPKAPTVWVDIEAGHLAAIHNVSFAMSKNPNSLISLQAVALRKGLAMAGTENRIVFQKSGLPITVNTLLMDRFITMLERGTADPSLLGFTESQTWIQYASGVQVWGAIPTVPWPDSTDNMLRDYVTKTKGVSPSVVWDAVTILPALERVLSFGVSIITVTITKGENFINFFTQTLHGEATESASTTAPNTATYEFLIDGALFRDVLVVTTKFWYLMTEGVLVFSGANGFVAVMGIIRK
jgi:hypothetical protein